LGNTKSDAWAAMTAAKDAYVLKPLVQLTAAPYALGVRGLYYQEKSGDDKVESKILRIGEGYKSVVGGKSGSNGWNGLIISGNVRINTANATEDKDTKLIVDSLDMYGTTINVFGDIYAPGGVIGAVWN
jgi:hypothetical protein